MPAAKDTSAPMAVDTDTATTKPTAKDAAPAPAAPPSVRASLLADLSLIDRSVELKDSRLTSRALRSLREYRRRFQHSQDDGSEFVSTINAVNTQGTNADAESDIGGYQLQSVAVINSSAQLSALKSAPVVEESMSLPPVDTGTTTNATVSALPPPGSSVESKFYLDLLFGLLLLDRKESKQSATFFTALFRSIATYNRRSMDLIAAKIYFYYAYSHEVSGESLTAVLPSLLTTYRTACLQHNEPGQAVLINAILRIYIVSHQFQLAETFRVKSVYPKDLRLISSPVYARYHYYVARIQCIQLAYSDAYLSLTQARRKIGSASSLGASSLIYAIDSLTIIAQLLMGEIPERSAFNSRELLPYLELTRAVRIGDLSLFHSVSDKYTDVFQRDDVLSLIQRLRHTVIKTGLRAINLSYSAIKLDSMAKKLALDDKFVSDSEALVVKAINDGVIDATIDGETHSMQSSSSNVSVNGIDTKHPSLTFHRRIQFALDIYNDAVKALAYPQTATGANIGAHDLDDDSDDEESFTAQQRRQKKLKAKEKEKQDKEKEAKDKGKDSDKDTKKKPDQ